jgi:hypothetical protein
MKEILTNKLHHYIRENNPDLLVMLEEKRQTGLYLNNKVEGIHELSTKLQKANTPDYVIEEACMDALTKDLRPSRYNYIENIFEEEFEYAFHNFQRLGVLVYEIINIINRSEELFKAFNFSEETEDNRQLRYAVTGVINEYLSK